MVLTNRTCEALNTATSDEEGFLSNGWDAHSVGWLIAGVTAFVSTVISLVTVFKHARSYYCPKEQRQIIRILFMPPVYSILSFFSYRYFRNYTYWSFGTVVYESLVLAAFLMLLLQYIGDSNDAQRSVMKSKDKRKIPIPFCCIRFRPSKPYFLHALKWSVLQYSLLRPLISIAGIVTEYYNVLCPTAYSIYFAEVYLDSIDFVSISVALYGLIVFYALVKERLAGKQPLAKFLSIKGIVMVTFYQSFVFSILTTHGVIKATAFWTAENVADGLQALCTCCEMVIFAGVFMWAFHWRTYRARRLEGERPTSVFWAVLDSLNYSDFFIEGWRGIVFTFRYILRKPGTSSKRHSTGFDLDGALAGKPSESSTGTPESGTPMASTPYNKNIVPPSQLPPTAFGRPSQDFGRPSAELQQSGYGARGYEMEEQGRGRYGEAGQVDGYHSYGEAR